MTKISNAITIPDQVWQKDATTWQIYVGGELLSAEFVSFAAAHAGLENEQAHRHRLERLRNRPRNADHRTYKDGRDGI